MNFRGVRKRIVERSGQIAALFQTVGGQAGYYDRQHDELLLHDAPDAKASLYLPRLFSRTENMLELGLPESLINLNGTTCALVHVTPDGVITVANLGDSRITLFIRSAATGKVRAFQLSEDHEPRRASEKQRIAEAHGWIKEGYMFIPGSPYGLSLTRAFGDRALEPALLHTPDISVFRLDDPRFGIEPGDEIILCADTDGAHYGTLQEERAIVLGRYLKSHSGDLPGAAEILGVLAAHNYSGDNISVMLLPLTKGRRRSIIAAAFDGHCDQGWRLSQSALKAMCYLLNRDIFAERHPKAARTHLFGLGRA